MAVQTHPGGLDRAVAAVGGRAPAATTLLEAVVVAALFAAGFAVLFRRWLFTGFDGIFGEVSQS